MKILSAAIGLTLALGLVAGTALPGLAAPEMTAPPTEYFQSTGEPPAWCRLLPDTLIGEVISIDEGKAYFVIQSQEQELTVSVNDDTKYFTAPAPQQLKTLAQNRVEIRQQNAAQFQISPQEPRKFKGSVSIKLRPNSAASVGKGKSAKAGATGRGPVDVAPGQEKKLRQQWQNQPELKQQNAVQWQERLNALCRSGEEATFADISAGAKVSVSIAPDSEDNLAKRVIIIKPVTNQPLVGTVTDIS